MPLQSAFGPADGTSRSTLRRSRTHVRAFGRPALRLTPYALPRDRRSRVHRVPSERRAHRPRGRGHRPRRPVHRGRLEPGRGPGQAGVSVRGGIDPPPPPGGRPGRPGRRGRPPRRRGRREAHRGAPPGVADHEHPGHRDRARRRRPGRLQDAHHLDVGDLRQERRRPGEGGRRPRHGLPVQGRVVVQHGQGGGRDPGQGVLARPRRSRDRRPAVQLRRSPPDRRVRDGRPPVRPAGPGRGGRHPLRGRRAAAVLFATCWTWSGRWWRFSTIRIRWGTSSTSALSTRSP